MAKSQNVFATWDTSWVKCVETHASTWMHPEFGLGMQVFVPAQRDAMTNMINNAICVNGMDKLRFAQRLALYNLARSEQIPGFNGSAHKQTWLNDPVGIRVRKTARLITVPPDSTEQLFNTN